MTFQVQKHNCTGCGLCIADCPPSVITLDDNKKAQIATENCMSCSHCAMICPVNAITADGQKLPEYPSGELCLNEQIEHIVRSKRSVRTYRNAPVAQADIDAILESGKMTATASNSMQCQATLLTGAQVSMATSLMATQLLKLVKFMKSPIPQLFIKTIGRKGPAAKYANKETIKSFEAILKESRDGGEDRIFFKAPAVVILTYDKKKKMFGRTDTALAGAHMMLTGHGRSVESCMIGFAELALKNKKVRAKLGIPANRMVGLVFTLGYTNKRYLRYPARPDMGSC